VYEYLTDEEKDIEQEIKNTEVESSDILKNLETLLFDGVIKQRKIRYSNGQDYPFTRKMDDRRRAASTSWPSTSSPLQRQLRQLTVQQRMQSMGRDELRVVSCRPMNASCVT
jgi:hypothetical protein